MLGLSPQQILFIIPTILIALTVHELSHAAAALALGDDTAKNDGRITLNPIKHIDPIGFFLILLAGFGWAKPVVFNREKLGRPVRDEILIALAGPISNLLLAFLGAVVLRFGLGVAPTISSSGPFVEMMLTFLSINTGLAVFNLIPIPPLDGSHIYTSVISEKSAAIAAQITRYGALILLGIILLQRFGNYNILPLARINQFMVRRMLNLVGLG